MKINKAFRYELAPNNKQVGLFVKTCGVARFAWNWGLSRRVEIYKEKEGHERFTTAMTQHKELVALKKDNFPWMYDVSKCAPQEALRNLDRAYTKFCHGHKEHKGTGLPKFKKKGVHDSFTLRDCIHVFDGYIQLPRIGKVKSKEPTIKFAGRILSVTVSREVDRWYCSLNVEVEIPEPDIIINRIIGIDLGLSRFAVISDGNGHRHIDAPKPLGKVISKVKRLNRQQSRKQKGSNNCKRANLKIARQYRKIHSIRKDFVSKLTSELTKTKSVVVIEDLNIKGMQNRKRHLGRSISDVSWGEFRRQLEYKSLWYGSRLIKIPRFEPSSKRCAKCGEVNTELKLSKRIWICQNCGMAHDRDENASDNIRNYGLNILSTESYLGSYACGEDVRPSEAVLVEAGNKRVHDEC